MHFTNLKNLTDGYKNSQNDYIMSTKFNILSSVPNLSEKGKVSVIASRPGMGKTTFMLQTALNYAINQNKPCYIFSLEMNKEYLLKRTLKMIPDFDTLIRLPISICDDISDIEDIEKAFEYEIKDGIVFIDYLWLVRSKIGGITPKDILMELKEIAEQKQISIVLTSQLSATEYEELLKNKDIGLQYYALAERFIFLNREPFLLDDYTENPNADNVYITIYENADITTKMFKWNSEKYCFEQ